MPDEPKKDHPEDIESILSDLDAILTDMGGAELIAPQPVEPEPAKPAPLIDIAPVAAPKAEPPKAEPPKAEPPKAEPPKAEPPKAEPPKPETPKAPPKVTVSFEPLEPVVDIPMPPKAAAPAEPLKFELPPPPPKPTAPAEPAKPIGPSIELAPRDGMIKPPEKKPEPPKPAAKLPNQTPIELSAVPPPPAAVEPPKAAAPPPPPPAPAPKPVEAKPADAPKAPIPAPPSPTAPPAPAPAVTSTTQVTELPADTPKEQIRRVAYIYTSSCSEVKLACATFLSQAARTISKKPIFLREVLSHEVGASSDPNAVLQKALQVKASSVLAIVEDWPSAKIEELSDACSRANVLFRAVAPADAQKKSTAVDIIVDMMLLPGEN